MVIHELSRVECLRVLAGAKLARLACVHENRPYVVPVYLAYDEASECLYGLTTAGQKIEWMRANPQVCVEVDEIDAPDQWVSVIVSGRYEELHEAPRKQGARVRAPERSRLASEAFPPWSSDSRFQLRTDEAFDDEGYDDKGCADEARDDEACADERERAWQAFKSHPMWWEPSFTAWAARTHRGSDEPFIPVYYKIRIDSITGHAAARDAKDAISYDMPTPPAEKWGRLCKILTRVFGSRSKEAEVS